MSAAPSASASGHTEKPRLAGGRSGSGSASSAAGRTAAATATMLAAYPAAAGNAHTAVPNTTAADSATAPSPARPTPSAASRTARRGRTASRTLTPRTPRATMARTVGVATAAHRPVGCTGTGCPRNASCNGCSASVQPA